MDGASFLELSISIALGLSTVALVLVIYRIMRGPTLPDRVLALDMLVSVGIGYVAIIAIKTGYMLYLDIAISLGLVGFLATVAFARYILQRWQIKANQTDGEATK